jgi:DNA primase
MRAIEEIKERIDIVDLISGYVPLKKAGRTYKGLCPFHAEKTPSFVVFPHTQTWHCFGACGTGGDIFAFLMQREGLDFSEALRRLAERAGVILEPPTPQSEVVDKRRARLLEMHAAAAQYYHHLLCHAAEGANARAYLSGREVNQDTVGRFQLGYALNAWDGLKAFLLKRGYSEEDLVAGGLLVRKESGEGSYDRFRNRLIIPIRDAQGQVIAFGARALAPNDVPKYLNSPQTPLFDKGSTLFGLDLARQAIREADQVVIVEGYMDVLSAHQRGHANVVAGMGTALTEAQLRQLKRLTKHFVLALDADSAGNAATLRGISTAREVLDHAVEPVVTWRGLVRFEGRLDADIRIAMLPPGRDPDDLLRESPDQWPQVIGQAAPVVSFTMHSLAAQKDLNTARGKSELVRQVLPLIKEVGDAVERTHYVSQLAQLVKVGERVVMAELERISTGARQTAAPPDTTEPVGQDSGGPLFLQGGRDFGQEEHVLALVIHRPEALAAADGELAAMALECLVAEDFQRSQNRSLFPLLGGWALTGVAAGETIAQLEQRVGQVDPLLQKHFNFLRQRGEVPTAVPHHLAQEELVLSVLSLRIQHVQAEIANLRFLQDESAVGGGDEEWRAYQHLARVATQRLQRLERARYQRSLTGQRREEAIRQGLALK